MAQTYSNDFFDAVYDCYHCYTDGNCTDTMFPDTDAKVYGMNVILALAQKAGVVVIAFVLMDNHVHFCLYGAEENCRRFMKLYVFAVANYLTKRFGHERKGIGFRYSVLAITTKGQLMKTIAYIFRNPLTAGFDRMPSEYPWSNASDCFVGAREERHHKTSREESGDPRIPAAAPSSAPVCVGGDFNEYAISDHSATKKRTIGDLTMVERRNVLKVRHQYPSDWTFDEYGVIDTRLYSGGQIIEKKIFGSVRRFLYFLALKCEDEVNDSMLRNMGVFLNDADVRVRAKALSLEKFGRQDIRQLPLDQKIQLVRALRKTMSCPNSQMARVIGEPVKNWIGFV